MSTSGLESIPLIQTKLTPPLVPVDLVSRPRLVERLKEGYSSGNRLTLVSAPAGYGKTSLVVDWLRQTGQPFAWLTLDESDNDPAHFFAYLLAALQRVYPDLGQTAEAMLQAPQTPHLRPLLTSLINDVNETTHLFVLDDYHVIEESTIHEAVSFLLDHMPVQMHLVIATRADPPLPVARLRGRGQLTELHAGDLRFTLNEINTFLNEAMGLALSPEQVDALEIRTEGWIAGLQMAALSMRGREDVSSFIQAFTGSHRYILDYLTEEVLNQQTEDIQAFLLKTSILDQMSGPLCAKVTEQLDSQSTLEALEAANLFMIPLDEDRCWYRYHPLFADLLRQRLQRENRELEPELHRRASEWFEEDGMIPEAVNHALAAGDSERAASLIEGTTWLKLAPREMTTLQGWLAVLPQEVLRSRPRLGIVRAWTLAVSGNWEAVESCLADLDIQQVQGEAAAIRAYVAIRQGDVVRTIDLGLQALEQLPEEDMFLRAVVALDLGVAYSSKGESAAAEEALNQAVRFSTDANLTYLNVAAMSTLGHVQDTQGLLQKAIETQWKALELAHEPGGQPIPIAGMAFVGIAEVLYEWNDLDGAMHNAKHGIKLLELGGFTSYQLIGYTVMTRVYHARGDLDGAMQVIQEAERLAQRHQYAYMETLLTSLRIRYYATQGDLASAERWARAQGFDLNEALKNDSEEEGIIAAWIRIVQASSQIPNSVYEMEKVLGTLNRLLAAEHASGRMWSVIKIFMLQALALQAMGEIDKAVSTLEQALSLAEPERFIRTFVDEGEIMESLLRHALSQGIAPDYITMLLAAMQETEEISQTKDQPLIDPLSERELEVLRLIAAGLSNQEIAQQLVIALSTVKSHINHIYGKLNVNSRTQAVARAQALDLL